MVINDLFDKNIHFYYVSNNFVCLIKLILNLKK